MKKLLWCLVLMMAMLLTCSVAVAEGELPTDPFTWEQLATIAGATLATLLVVQLLKLPLSPEMRQPQHPAESWETTNGVTAVSPISSAQSASRTRSRDAIPGTSLHRASATGRIVHTAADVLRSSTSSPLMWSVCSCVIRIAERASGEAPESRMPSRMRRAEIPASISRCVSPSETSVQFPVEPLARTEIFIRQRPSARRARA